jgi:hypothetical protein
MRFDLEGRSFELLERPRRSGEELELVFGFSLRDAVRSDQAVVVSHNRMLHAAYGKFGETIDAEALEKPFCVGTFEREWSCTGQTCLDIAALLLGHALGLPAAELPRPN